MFKNLKKIIIPRSCFFIIIFLPLLILKLSSVNAADIENWCMDTKFGQMPGNHPQPGIKNGSDPCPGKYLKKFPFKKVESYFSKGVGKKHVCNLIEGSSRTNERLTVWFDLASHINLDCKDEAKDKARLKAQEKERRIKEQQAVQKAQEKERKLALKEKNKNNLNPQGLPKCSGNYHNCVGTYSWPDNKKYVGQFMNGKIEGLGKLIYPNGSVYRGSFKNNKINANVNLK